jgi:hypothetical protein
MAGRLLWIKGSDLSFFRLLCRKFQLMTPQTTRSKLGGTFRLGRFESESSIIHTYCICISTTTINLTRVRDRYKHAARGAAREPACQALGNEATDEAILLIIPYPFPETVVVCMDMACKKTRRSRAMLLRHGDSNLWCETILYQGHLNKKMDAHPPLVLRCSLSVTCYTAQSD